MDLDAPFKPETLRPFISIVVPGLIALSPFVLLLGVYVPSVETFRTVHSEAFAILVAIGVLAAGFVISDFGELIEVHWWDARLSRLDPDHTAKWNRYLKLRLNDELIAQRFLRTKLTQFKFELAMTPALVTSWCGLFWLQAVRPIWSWKGFLLFSVANWLLAAYLLWESWSTAEALASIRGHILDAIDEGPKGIAPAEKDA
jgi:hypothetical protein